MPPDPKCGHGDWHNASRGAYNDYLFAGVGNQSTTQRTRPTMTEKTSGNDARDADDVDPPTITTTAGFQESADIQMYRLLNTLARVARRTRDEMILDIPFHWKMTGNAE